MTKLDPINLLAEAIEAAADGDCVASWLDPIVLAGLAVKTLTEAGGVMPEEAEKLRVDLKRAQGSERMASQHAHRCDADVAEADAESKRLAAELATINAVQARHRANWYEERDGLRAEVEATNAQRDDYGRELAEFRHLHLEHLARCNQQAHRESLLNIWDMVKKAEAERDLLRVQLHDAHERIALALVVCKDLEPYALPGDALQLARKVVGILARDGGVDGPRSAVTASAGLERQNGTSGAVASAEGEAALQIKTAPTGDGNA